MEKSMENFIEENSEEIVLGIKNYYNVSVSSNDYEEIEMWVINDEGLYNWARAEGVDV